MVCGATIRLDSGDEITVSIAKAGVLVRSTTGFLGSFFGAKLYEEKNIDKNVRTVLSLRLSYPNQVPELGFRNPNLRAFANAIWHCRTAAEVRVVLNQAASKVLSPQEAAYAVALQEAVIETSKTRPKHPPEQAPADCRVEDSNAVTEQHDAAPSELKTDRERQALD